MSCSLLAAYYVTASDKSRQLELLSAVGMMMEAAAQPRPEWRRSQCSHCSECLPDRPSTNVVTHVPSRTRYERITCPIRQYYAIITNSRVTSCDHQTMCGSRQDLLSPAKSGILKGFRTSSETISWRRPSRNYYVIWLSFRIT